MKSALKLLAKPSFVLTLTNMALHAAVAWAEEAPGTPDGLCDYCKDYSDAATSAGEVRSRYRPGTGYAVEPESQAVAMRKQKETGFGSRAKPATERRDKARE